MLKKYLDSWIVALILFSIISFIFIFPIFNNINNLGIMDWDVYLFYNAVNEKTILEFKQVPLWNPYHCGGNVQLAYSETFFITPLLILILLFGTVIGSKISILAHIIIGMLGMFLLSKYLRFKTYSSYLSAFIFMLSSQYAIHITAGHFEWTSLAFFPFVFLFYLKSLKDIKNIVWCVLFLVTIVFMAPYGSIFIFLFLILYSIFETITKKDLNPIKIMLLITALTFILGSVKLLPSLDILSDSPRLTPLSGENEGNSLKNLFDVLIKPTLISNYFPVNKIPPNLINNYPKWWEDSMYIGAIPFLLLLSGLLISFKKNKPILFTTIFISIIYLGNTSPINLWKYLHLLPIFDSFNIIMRFSGILIFCFALLIGLSLSKLEEIMSREEEKDKYFGIMLKILILSIVLFTVIDLVSTNKNIFDEAFVIDSTNLKGSSEKEFYQTLRNYDYGNNNVMSSFYASLLDNKGQLDCHYIGVRVPASGSAISKESDLYKGEVYLKEGKGNATLEYFSPNKLKIKINSDDEDILVVNQNYHRGWKAKNKEIKPYNGLMSTNIEKGESNIELYYLPNSFIIGFFISVFGILLILILYKKPKFINKILFLIVLVILLEILILSVSKDSNLSIPKIYYDIGMNKEDYKIIELPLKSQLFNAYKFYQTIHNKDIVGNFVWPPTFYTSEIPFELRLVQEVFKQDVEVKNFSEDILIQDNLEVVNNLLNYYNIKWIILHKKWYGHATDYSNWDKDSFIENKKIIEDVLKITPKYEDEELIAYEIPHSEIKPFVVLDKKWFFLELWDGNIPTRWINNDATIKVMHNGMEKNKLRIKASNYKEIKTLELYLNNNLVGSYKIDGWTDIITKELEFKKGENILKLHIKESCQSPEFDKRCLNIAIREIQLIQ